MTQSLNDVFRAKRELADAERQRVDWGQRRDEWIARVNTLYQTLTGLLAEPLEHQLITLERVPKTVTEEHIGPYAIDDLVLTVGDERVVFSPAGRNIVGAQGRIDIRGESGEAMLVALPDGRWSIVKSRTPTLRLTPLDAQTFAEALFAVMRR